MGNPCDGIILMDKNESITSFDVVKRVRKVLKINKVGHAGTLDPFATGLLIILLGQGTKLSPFLMDTHKVYQATMRLGIKTETQDLTGRVIQTKPVPKFEREYIKEIARGFIGEIEQVPPVFSALKYKGKRAYEFARKGIKVDLKSRKVKIHSLEMTSIDLPDMMMKVACSRGTYIRTLASDLGERLGTGAYLIALRRLAIGPFNVKDALASSNIGLDSADKLRKAIIPLREALPHIKGVLVDAHMAQKIRDGCQPRWEEEGTEIGSFDPPEYFVKIVSPRELVAIIRVNRPSIDEKGGLKIMRVFC
ncbi:MAG: tRNA pseudouridine(55) synthase TruB [Pseudomonadota bacterium]